MGKLSNVSARKAIRAFEKSGFSIVSQKGSHIKMRRIIPGKIVQTIIIPDHKTLKEGTLKNGILRRIGMSDDEFIKRIEK